MAGCGAVSTGTASASTGAAYAQYFHPTGAPVTVTSARAVPIRVGPGLTFTPDAFYVRRGEKVSFTLQNVAAIPHNFTLAAANLSVALAAGKTVPVTFTAPAKAGTYYFYCNITGHAQGGMVGKLIVR